jgi:hypothetical protein
MSHYRGSEMTLGNAASAKVGLIHLALGIVLMFSAALSGCAGHPPPGWDPYSGYRAHGSRALGDQ